MDDTAYEDVIVGKPWGYEYLMFRNAHIALWYLFIRCGERTSLHCHPRKKTGLIVLSGAATIRFLNNSSVLRAPANTMIRPGLFHQTDANLGADAMVIEIESPVDKMNLVRLEDSYGRENKAYGSVADTRPWSETCLKLPQPVEGEAQCWNFCGQALYLYRRSDAKVLSAELNAQDVVVVLEGGLFSDGGEPILTSGDAVSGSTVIRLSQAFKSPEGIAALVIADPATLRTSKLR